MKINKTKMTLLIRDVAAKFSTWSLAYMIDIEKVAELTIPNQIPK